MPGQNSHCLPTGTQKDCSASHSVLHLLVCHSVPGREYHLHLGSCTPLPNGLINCGLFPDPERGLLFLVLMDKELDGTREIVCDRHLELRDVSALSSRFLELMFKEAMRCSLAILEAFVSRANLGMESLDLEETCCTDGGTGSFLAGIVWLRVSLFRRVLGAPRPEGLLINLLSADDEVGRSSNDANSLPSPKFRRRVGRVSVRFPPARKFSGLVSLGFPSKMSERLDRDERDASPWELNVSFKVSEFVRLE